MAAQEIESGSKDPLFYAGVHVEPQAIARMAERFAPQMREAQSRVVATPPPTRIPIFHIKADGTGVPVRKSEVRGRKAKSGEVKLGAIFTQICADPRHLSISRHLHWFGRYQGGLQNRRRKTPQKLRHVLVAPRCPKRPRPSNLSPEQAL